MFFIVRRQRKRQGAAERAKEREIDDNMELTWVPAPKSNGEFMPPSSNVQQPATVHAATKL